MNECQSDDDRTERGERIQRREKNDEQRTQVIACGFRERELKSSDLH
ncbi:MAG: hypothetical protein WCY56_06195 [Aminobacteriaceae bacterium]